MFSARTAQERTLNPLSHKLADHRDVLDLTVSNPTRIGISIAGETIEHALAAGGKATYERSPRGLPQARQAVADYYSRRGVAVDPEQVILTATTSEAYHALFGLLADPGETILVGRPSYPLIAQLATLCGLQAQPFSVRPHELDVEAIDAGLAAGAPAIAVVSPNNPTGSCLSIVERRTMLLTAQSRGAAIISDEVFLDYLDEPERFAAHSFARSEETFTATLSGLSKVAGQPGLKLSWIVLNGPKHVVEEARGRLEVWLDAFLSVATPVQHALAEILEASDAFQAEIRDRRLENVSLVRDACRGTAVTASCGDGGWYAVLQLPAVMSDEAWGHRAPRAPRSLHPSGLPL